MSEQLPHQGPTKGACEGRQDKCARGDCPIFGTLLVASRDGLRRIRGCGDPVARGKRNKRKGQTAQRKIANKLGIPVGWGGSNEETWQSSLRLEIKAGQQIAPVINAYRRQRKQSEASRPIGDHRPFAAVCVHDGMELFICEVDDLHNVAAGVLEDRDDATK